MKPQPRRRANGKLAITLHDRDELKVWMQILIKGIREQVGIVPIIKNRRVVGVETPWPHAGPVTVDAVFHFERTLSVNGWVIPSHHTSHPTAEDIGDEDTLRRALLDALTQSGLIADDRWVIGGSNLKRWADRAGVWCEIRSAP